MISFRIVLLLLPLLERSVSGVTYSCETLDSKEVKGTCLLSGVTLRSNEEIGNATFPRDVTSGSLKMVDGLVASFSHALARKLADVSDLIVDGMGIKELVVWPTWEHLSAQNNSIATLVPASASFFAGLTDADQCKLRTLQLQNNELTSVPPFGRRFRQLKVLKLDENLLESVTLNSFANLEQLQTLSLASNRLIQVVAGPTGVQLLKLKHLSLANNRLMDLQVANWEMESLQSLDMSGNGLYQLSEPGLVQFRALKELRYAGNDWNCELLSAMQRYLQQKTIVVTDHEFAGRCEAESLTSLQSICCYEPAAKDFSLDLFGERWEQLNGLQRRYELVKFDNDQVEAENLNAIMEHAYNMRANLSGKVANNQDILEGGIERLRLSVAAEAARIERLTVSNERAMADIHTSIEDLHRRATRRGPTLDGILHESLTDSISRIEKNILKLRRRILQNLADYNNNESRMRKLDDHIAGFEKTLAKQKQSDAALDKQVQLIEQGLNAMIKELDLAHNKPERPPSSDAFESDGNIRDWIRTPFSAK